MRGYDSELQYRRELRQKYFEDPNYRRWSDIVLDGIEGRQYMAWRDDRLFDYIITGQVTRHSRLSTIQIHLEDGYELPINWSNFYAYFDERLNDPNNTLMSELIEMSIGDSDEEYCTVKDLLDQYREHLYNSYDIV